MTYVKAKSNTAFSPMRDPIDRRPLHIGIVLLVGVNPSVWDVISNFCLGVVKLF